MLSKHYHQSEEGSEVSEVSRSTRQGSAELSRRRAEAKQSHLHFAMLLIVFGGLDACSGVVGQ